MKMEELLEMYKNLDMKERIKFDREYNKFNEEEKLKQLTKRKEVVEDRVLNEEGQQTFHAGKNVDIECLFLLSGLKI